VPKCRCEFASVHRPDPTVIEYERLKQEQLARITSRDNLVYGTLMAVGGVCGAALDAGSWNVLMAVPLISIVLVWVHLSNDLKVSQIGRHIEHTLAPRIPASIDPFPWESAHRTLPSDDKHRRIQTAVTLLTFCGPAIAAIITTGVAADGSPLTLSLLAVEGVGFGLLAEHIIAAANPPTRR
jgi:hypothetical protein